MRMVNLDGDASIAAVQTNQRQMQRDMFKRGIRSMGPLCVLKAITAGN